MDQYFTLEALLAYPTAVIAVTLVVAVVGYLGGEVMRPALKWVALAVSFVLAYLAAYLASPSGWTGYVVAFFNACVIFLAAVGANALTAERPAGMRAFDRLAVPHSWRMPWL